jgi:ADP-ribose pyrophosphatase YjhB (NUDIX family)
MPTPHFILSLREKIGQDLLLLPGVNGVVLDETGRLLLGRRADTGEWALPAGICEPDEQPAETIVREVLEETGVHCEAERLVLVETLKPITYPNGDRCQFLDITFRCRATGGEARVADEESLEVAWFALDALPPLEHFSLFRIERALDEREAAWFARTQTEVDDRNAVAS